MSMRTTLEAKLAELKSSYESIMAEHGKAIEDGPIAPAFNAAFQNYLMIKDLIGILDRRRGSAIEMLTRSERELALKPGEPDFQAYADAARATIALIDEIEAIGA